MKMTRVHLKNHSRFLRFATLSSLQNIGWPICDFCLAELSPTWRGCGRWLDASATSNASVRELFESSLLRVVQPRGSEAVCQFADYCPIESVHTYMYFMHIFIYLLYIHIHTHFLTAASSHSVCFTFAISAFLAKLHWHFVFHFEITSWKVWCS